VCISLVNLLKNNELYNTSWIRHAESVATYLGQHLGDEELWNQ